MATSKRRSLFGRAVLTAVGCLLIVSPPVWAQYTANYQTNIVSGVTSNWSGFWGSSVLGTLD